LRPLKGSDPIHTQGSDPTQVRSVLPKGPGYRPVSRIAPAGVPELDSRGWEDAGGGHVSSDKA